VTLSVGVSVTFLGEFSLLLVLTITAISAARGQILDTQFTTSKT
jgi:hypothetical protein